MDNYNYRKNNHMKKRCFFITIMCLLSLIGWYHYNIYDPFNFHYISLYFLNNMIMIFYLLWDIYCMIISSNRMVLYRKDLIIHHFITLIVYLSYTNKVPIVTNNVLIMESISLMNTVLKNHAVALKIYRTIVIFVIRIPICLWMLFYYNPRFIIPQFIKQKNYYLAILSNIYILFILYDINILIKLYGLKKKLLNIKIA